LAAAPEDRLSARAVLPADGETNALHAGDFVVWQLIDSAFPTGGFAHSNGLEAAWQHGEVRGRTELISFLEAGLNQIGRAALPLATAAFSAPGKLGDFDALCDAFTTNHVANRASRAQGRALLMAVERIFKPEGQPTETTVVFGHLAPVFGACLGRLKVSRDTMTRMFLFNHLRGLLAAAVRLNIVGPMEAQMLQHRLRPQIEEVLRRCGDLGLEDLAQTAPLMEIWQGAQDRLYSRLFQS
jgi:urease accessory protein